MLARWKERAVLRHGYAVAAVAAATILTVLLAPFLEQTISVIYIPAVILTAWRAGRGPGILATLLSVLAIDYLTPPVYGFHFSFIDFIRLTVFAATSLLTSFLTTNLVRAEDESRQQREWLQLTLASIGDGVIATDDQGRVAFLNPAAELLTGRSGNEARGKPLEEVFRAMDPDTGLASPRTGPSSLLQHRDGTRRTIEESRSPIRDGSGAMAGAVIVFRDITLRRQAEEKQAWLSAIVESSEDAVIGKDLEGTILSWNRGAQRIYGYSGPEVVGKSVKLIMPPERHGDLSAILERLMRGEKLDHHETQRVRKDGRRIDVSLTISPVHDGGGRVVGASAIARDITEKKRMEAELRRLNEELEERVARRTAQLAEANRELEAFCYSVSHDLRAPLRAIDGFTRLLVEGHGAGHDGEFQRLAGIIRESARNMGRLIDDLLAFSRLGRKALDIQEVDMEGLARAVFEDLRAAEPERSIELRLHPLPPARGDLCLMRQVLANLLENAIKFTRPRPRAVVEVGGQVEGQEVSYWVRDNGVGFDMRYVGKIFGVFQRLHEPEEFEGTGVGLAIVQRIIARHGGQVRAEGAVDRGATIHFTLPPGAASSEEEGSDAEARSDRHPARRGQHR